MSDNAESSRLVNSPAEIAPSDFLLGADEIGRAIGRNGRQARTRTRQTRWIVVRRRRRASHRIPVYVRHSELLWNAVNGGVA